MKTLFVWFRVLVLETFLSLCISFPIVLVSFQPQLAWVGVAIAVAATWLFCTQIERIYIKKFKAIPEESAKYRLSKNVRLFVIDDPNPNLLVVRSLFGKGSLFLNRGLIALLNESEIESVIAEAAPETRRPGLVLQGLCSLMAGALLSLAPAGWVRFFFSNDRISEPTVPGEDFSIVTFLWFCVLVPWVKFLLFIGGRYGFVSQNQALSRSQALFNAVQKIRDTQIYGSGQIWYPTSLYHYIFHPAPIRHPLSLIPG
ncbi:hypothetical protein K2X30_01270 [bacterium]|jgi:Zn-dependent protease with chaperone function|nr:hypothetical protein [bacterium]